MHTHIFNIFPSFSSTTAIHFEENLQLWLNVCTTKVSVQTNT